MNLLARELAKKLRDREAAIARVLALADMMDKDTDVYTRALAASIRNTVTGGSDG